MRLMEEPFNKIKNGQKVIEVRVFDEKRQALELGDEIIFTKRPEETEEVHAKIVGLFRYPSFRDLFEGFPPEDFGYSSREELITTIYENYSKEEEIEFGVIGIRIKLT